MEHTSTGPNAVATEDIGDKQSIILHVLLCAFHHRFGPCVEFCYPPLPPLSKKSEAAARKQDGSSAEGSTRLPLPPEWSDLPFFCLPDGAHMSEEEFTYFHLSPVAEWPSFSASTTFGMACCRQIKASELVNKTADITRNTVVVLAKEPVYGAIRSILASGTEAFFNQRDFSQTDMLVQLYENLNQKVPTSPSNETLYQATRLVDVIRTFRQRALVLFKLLLLERRTLFYGSDVENLCNVQYSLVSLIPELLAHLKDVGSPELEIADQHPGQEKGTTLASKLGMPLRIFQKGAYFQPYCPLQKMTVLFDKGTRTFVAGVTNQIFVEKARREDSGIHAVVDIESGAVEIFDRHLEQAISLTPPDKKFMDDLIAAVDARADQLASPTESASPLGYEGSDEDIRSKFEQYLFGLLSCCHTSRRSIEGSEKTKDKGSLNEYGLRFVETWMQTLNYERWQATELDQAALDSVPSRHPCSGTTLLGEFQKSITSRFKDLKVEERLSDLGTAIQKATAPRSGEDAGEDSNPMRHISGVFNQIGGLLRRGRST